MTEKDDEETRFERLFVSKALTSEFKKDLWRARDQCVSARASGEMAAPKDAEEALAKHDVLLRKIVEGKEMLKELEPDT